MSQVKYWANRYAGFLALVAGGVAATGFAPLHYWYLALPALAALFALCYDAHTLRSALWRGWCFGLGHFIIGLNWIAGSFQYQEAMPAWLGWVAVVVLSAYIAVYPMLVAGFSHIILKIEAGYKSKAKVSSRSQRSHQKTGRPFVYALGLVAAWILTEWLRSIVFTGFAWNPMGVMAVDVGQVSTLIGTYGLSGLWMMAAAVVWLVTIQEWKAARLMAVLPLFALGLSWWGGSLPVIKQGSAQPLVRVVQPNIGQADKWRVDAAADNAESLASLSGIPTKEPRLVLWPEAAVPEYLEDDPVARLRLARLLGAKDILVTGGVAVIRDDVGQAIGARNSFFALNANAQITGRYDKSHLVPYGEYLPMRPVLSAIGLSRLVPGNLDFWAGDGPRTVVMPHFGKMGGQICYEMIFSGHVIDRQHRPDFIFNPSNDAWFGSWGPPQHLAQARLRAMEEGVPIIRSTPTGISAVIDADGRIVSSLAYHQAGAIDARLPVPHGPTFFARHGNVIPLCFALFLLFVAIALRRFAR